MATIIKKSLPKDVFINLLSVAALYASIVSFIALIFQYVNVLFPDPLNFYYTSILDTIRRAGSALLVVFPVYLVVSWLLGKEFAADSEKKQLRIRRWLLYFTLFLSAVTIIVDLIILIYNFWGGELTMRFLLKILAVMIAAAAVFGYHIWDLKKSEPKKSLVPKIAAWISAIVVLALIAGGFFVIGGPATQRDRRFDDRRVSDLQTLQNGVINYWIAKDVLPKSLDDLRGGVLGGTIPRDPQTGNAYEYIVAGNLEFSLCAAFKTENKYWTRGEVMPVEANYYDSIQQDWGHKAERTCFSKKIDPAFYKNRNGGPVPLKTAPY